MLNFWRQYLLPGFIFQSIIIAGGYGTGREFVEFFLQLGPKAGMLAMILATVIWSVVCACTFALARYFKSYDYRTFFQGLLGRWWWLFEICYLLMLILVMAIVVATAGSFMEQTFGIAYGWGVAGLILYVTLIVYKGSRTIEYVLSFWSIALYAVYGLLFFFGFQYFGEQISANWQADTVSDQSWILNGIRYAGYNLALVPAVLFCLTHQTTQRQAVISGIVAGVVAIFPGVLFYIIMTGEYPHIINETVPSLFLLGKMELAWLEIAFTIVLLGTLIETATGMIHALNESIATQLRHKQRHMPAWTRGAVAFVVLLGSLLLAQIGLVNLISKGYGWLTWLVIAVYVAPALYKGLPLLFNKRNPAL
jgi:uncharacterized membrane protein YkvI